ncbi:MAG: RNA methyltransferase [Bacilli bacterium]|jgi:TrmH family RNA methyltransferase|nr:RNA methyltransferase [Bacilli bacterium]
MNREDNIITSFSNPIFKELLDLKENGKKSGRVLIEGEDGVKIALNRGLLVKTVTCEYDYAYAEKEEIIISKELMRKLSSYNSLPKVIGIVEYKLASKAEGERIVYLDGIQDPGNLGTLMRNALAFSYRSLVLSKDCVSPYNFKAVQASKGAFLGLDITYESLTDLKNDGYKIISADLKGEDIKKFVRPEGKICLVIGSEGQGIKKENLLLSDYRVLLPIEKEIDSLNAGVAGGIMMYLLR